MTTIAGCATPPSTGSSPGLSSIAAQLSCPKPPLRLVETVPPPAFAPQMNWVDWSDALLVWGADQAKRRHDLVAWLDLHCNGGAL
jgi:hypothetical protein